MTAPAYAPAPISWLPAVAPPAEAMPADVYFDARGCERCGERDPCCLEFHHKDPSQKTGAIAVLCGWSWKRLEAEIAKCVVLCANCHCRAHASRDPARSRAPGARAKVSSSEAGFSWIY